MALILGLGAARVGAQWAEGKTQGSGLFAKSHNGTTESHRFFPKMCQAKFRGCAHGVSFLKFFRKDLVFARSSSSFWIGWIGNLLYWGPFLLVRSFTVYGVFLFLAFGLPLGETAT